MVGFKALRELRRNGSHKQVAVQFANKYQAFVSIEVLQNYIFDRTLEQSPRLRLSFTSRV